MCVDTKLDVMANSWPLYFVISMFLNSYFIEIEGIVNSFFETVVAQLKKFKEDTDEASQPGANMLKFYQLKNLIYTYSSIVRFLLCFQTPMTEKTTSQLYSTSQGNLHS